VQETRDGENLSFKDMFFEDPAVAARGLSKEHQLGGGRRWRSPLKSTVEVL
jgi:hypothetical protein